MGGDVVDVVTELLDSIKCCNYDVILCDVSMYINVVYFLSLLIIYELIELLCCVPIEYFTDTLLVLMKIHYFAGSQLITSIVT